MPSQIEATHGNNLRLSSILALTGIPLWLGGLALGLLGHAMPGGALRSIAILLFAVATLSRSSLMLWTFLAMLAGVELGLDAPRFASPRRSP